jgi:beta-glucosidase-like glycosyl hydrolase/CubicO group peptidase (beta-lactamase class C family)
MILFIASCATQKDTVKPPQEVKKETPIPSHEMQNKTNKERAGASGTGTDTLNWASQKLRQLSLEEKVGQMVVSKAVGSYSSDDSRDFKKLERLVRELKVGGIYMSAGNVYEDAMLLNKLQSMVPGDGIPLLVPSDYEYGVAMRAENATMFPNAMALGATRNPNYAYQMGKVVAMEGRAIGVHQAYAPTVDVNSNPDNPIINVRSFGEDPDMVSKMAQAFIKGMQDGGMVSTAKHFPGHGSTSTDSHSDLPLVTLDRELIEKVDLLPFKGAVTAGVMSVMIAHLSVPSLDGQKALPSTLSRRIVTDLLRNEMDFKGLIVTDAMEMAGVSKYYSVAEASVMAVKAGVDVILLSPDEETAIRSVVSAVRRGEIPQKQIDESVLRILSLKQWLGLDNNRFIDVNKIAAVVGTREHWQLAKEIARESITLLKNDGNILPLTKDNPKRIVCISMLDNSNYRTGDHFSLQLGSRYSNVSFLRLDSRSTREEYSNVLERAMGSDLVICPTYVKVRSGQGTVSLPKGQAEFVRKLTKLKRPVVMISFGNPYLIRDFEDVSSYMCAYGDGDMSVEAAVEALFGEIPLKGKLPVNISDSYVMGSGIEMPKTILRQGSPSEVGMLEEGFAKVDDIINKAIQDSAFPCAVLLVAKDGMIVYNKAYGTYDYSPYSKRINTRTIFDLASVTKVIATTSAAMKLYDLGKLDLDEKVANYIPDFGQNGKENITIRNLLVHNSGLPAWKSFYKTCNSADQVLDSVYASPLEYPTGTKMVYSDLGIITMGKIIEKLSGVTLDKYVAKEFFEPLGMFSTMYNPPDSLIEHIAPTELDNYWRMRVVRGRVHDENAAALGGVSGHAGLFSTASDLAILVQMLLNGGKYGGRSYIREETVRLFTKRQSDLSTRGLGWDTKSPHGSSAGELFSPTSFGHTGFTGTSVWADPEKRLFVVLLTNRVYPTRDNTKIFRLRPAVHDAVVECIKAR